MNHQIYAEAADWLVEFRTGDHDAHTRKRFDAWIRQSPAHLRAYLEITEIWQDASFVEDAAALTRAQLVAAARTEEHVVPLAISESRGLGKGGGVPRWRNKARYGLAASILLLLAAGGVYLYTQRGAYTTATGEQHSVNLADGSVIQLNAQTRIRVRYTAERRDVELIRGEALFRVAKDAQRPFLVRSHHAQVRALGTQFDIYQKNTGTIVTVVEGAVAVTPPFHRASLIAENNGSNVGAARTPAAAAGSNVSAKTPPSMNASKALVLTAGDRIVVNATTASSIEKANISSATAWTQRQLVFKSSPLSEVAEEFNRYNARRLIVEGGNLADFHISGVYSANDPALLIRFLREQSSLAIRETDDAIFVSRAE